jgi:ketosteroid isomerase-like protein
MANHQADVEQRDTRDLVDAWLAARLAGDFDRLASLTAADAVWHSPVEGRQVGRSAVIDEVRLGFANTDTFESRILDVQCHDETVATAKIRNIATRHGRHLDSVQTLYLEVEDAAVSSVRIEVDDPAAVEAFWR